MVQLKKLNSESVKTLKEYCKKKGYKGYSKLKKLELISLIELKHVKTKKNTNTHFGTRNKPTRFDLLPDELSREVYKFINPNPISRAVTFLVNDKPLDFIDTVKTIEINTPIPFVHFNAAKQGILIKHSGHPRKTYTPLEFTQTHLHQLDSWLNGDYFEQDGRPDSRDLKRRINNWKKLEKTLLQKATNEQRDAHGKRKKMIDSWNKSHFNSMTYPAGYFIDLQKSLNLNYPTAIYEDYDEDQYFDPDGNSLYRKSPLSRL